MKGGFQVEHVGTGGVMLRWEDGRSIPADLDIFSDDVHVARQPLVRFQPDNVQVTNLADADAFPASVGKIRLLEGRSARLAWGTRISDDWAVEGEDTPFCYREHAGDHEVCRFDLTDALGIDGLALPGETYRLSLDIAQHRCGVGLAIEWLDGDNQPIDREEAWRETGPLGGRNPAGYERLSVSSTCPRGAARIRPVLLLGPPTAPPDAYMFVRRPQLIRGAGEDRSAFEIAGVAPGADLSRLAMLPIGDVLGQHAGPFSIGDGAGRIDLPPLDALVPTMGDRAVATANGGYLDINVPGNGSHDDPAVYVVIDGQLHDFLPLDWHDGGHGASLRLPQRLLDGDHHWVEVRGAGAGETLHAGRHHFASFMTPVPVLQQFTSRIERPGVLPLSRYRYEALDAAIERLGRSGQVDGAVLAEINACHRYLLGGPQENQVHFAPRNLPRCDAPRFSIVVPVHNKFYFTYFCLAAIIYSCAGLPYEVIVVDDGSSDPTGDIERMFANLRVVRHAKAQGFVGACNAGAAAARGEYIVFLNNDTEVTGRWLEELALPFEGFADVGLTGAMLLYPDGRLQEAGCIIWNNGKPWNYGRDGNPADPIYSYTRQADYISGAALMVSRDAWDAVGGFSREFAPAYYEDTDLAFKLRDAGYRTIFAAKAPVIHYEGVSAGTVTTSEGMKRFQEVNRPTFEGKWHDSFAGHAAEGTSPELEKDRGQIGRALVLDYQPPRFDKDAGSYAISQEIRILQGLGYKVTMAPANCAHLGLYTEALERAGVEHLHAPFFSSLHEVLERRGEEFDLVYIHRYTTAEGIIEAVRHYAPDAKILVNCADLHFLREIRAARVSGSQEAFDAALKRRQIELEVLSQADCVLTYSESEKAVLESYLDLGARVQVLPWVVEPAPAPPVQARDGICFLGSFDHPPNRDAVEFFLAECWPHIADANPGLEFTIAGSGFERFVPRADASRVKVLGWVEDAQAFLATQRLMVAPLRSGAGVKGKVFDALACGTPAVLSPVAAEGIAVGPSVAPVARTAEEWSRHVTHLLADEGAWVAAAEAGLAFMRHNYSFASGRERFERIFEAVDLPFAPAGQGGALVPRHAIRDLGKLRMKAMAPVDVDAPDERAAAA